MVLSSCVKRPHLNNFSVMNWKTGTNTDLKDECSWHRVTFAVFSNFSWRKHPKSDTRRSSTSEKSLAFSSLGERQDISFIVTKFTNAIVSWPSETDIYAEFRVSRKSWFLGMIVNFMGDAVIWSAELSLSLATPRSLSEYEMTSLGLMWQSINLSLLLF